MSLGKTLSGFWHRIQADLFPWLEEELGPLGERYRRFVTVLELARVESFLPHFHGLPGRPVEDRAALARAFIAKAVFDVPTTRALIERLEADKTLRHLCGWTWRGEIPSEATFSRAFAEFSEGALPERVHEALIKQTLGDHLVGHVSRDSTAIEAREKPQPRPKAEKPKRKRGRPPQGRGAAQGGAPRETPAHDELAPDARRPAESLRRRHQAERQGPYHIVDRLQAAHRRRRWRHPDQLHPDVRLAARQPGRDPAGEYDRRPRHQSVRPHGLSL